MVVATAVRTDRDREVLGLDLGVSEDAAFSTRFLRSLVARGLEGVRVVIRDVHEDLQQAVQTPMGAGWPRCRVHDVRGTCLLASRRRPRPWWPRWSAQSRSDRTGKPLTPSWRSSRPCCATQKRWHGRRRPPRIPAFMQAPPGHRCQIDSTNLLARLNKEMGRRTDVVGICPNQPRSSDWSGRCRWSHTTSGLPRCGATSVSNPWPSGNWSAGPYWRCRRSCNDFGPPVGFSYTI